MPTLKDRLLDGKVIGEMFRSGEHPYKVLDIHIMSVSRGDFVCLVVQESDGKLHHYDLVTKLHDVYVEPRASSETTQESERLGPLWGPADTGDRDNRNIQY